MADLMADPGSIIRKYYPSESLAYEILMEHSEAVAAKALQIAGHMQHLSPDMVFLREAALLHDIGIFLTDEPGLGCFGDEEYICHGYLGRGLLEREGLPAHALVCERHTGAGLTASDIERLNLPLPLRDMMPLSLEEKIICYADTFFSKNVASLSVEKSLDRVRAEIARHGEEYLRRFEELHRLFSK